MEEIYVFGHKKPDTDSVTSAIALSNLKNKLGVNTIPTVLGEINNETEFVLNHFNVSKPKYLNDVKLQIKDLNYKRGHYINENKSLFYTFNYMNENFVSNIPIINDKSVFLGTVSMKDIARDLISGNFDQLEASYDNIIETLGGKEILRFDDEINGNILMASYKSTTFIENIEITPETILIIGDRHSIIEFAVNNKAKLIILTGSSKIRDIHLEIAKKNRVNIIKTDYFSFKVAKLIGLSNYVKQVINNKDIICFDENEDVKDFVETANKKKFSFFPVINKKNQCLGILKLSDVAEKNKKKVILVDHNEYEQSVDGLDEAEIVEIIDHHKIGSIGTSIPINFRNMPVGSSNTIVYLLYKENNVEVSKQMAGLMLSGILSDTLMFVSPTTTELDKKVGVELTTIAQLDYKNFAMEMFKAGSLLKGKTEEEIFYTDFKNFTIDDKKVGVSQISTVNIDDIITNSEKYIELINRIAENNNYYILALFVTDIIKNGSYIFFNNNSKDFLNNCFGDNLNQGTYLDNIISRKKQIIPTIMDELDKK